MTHPETGLVFAPSLWGHRTVYVSTVAEFLLARGLSVVIAAPFSTIEHRSASRVFDRLEDSGRVSWLDVSGEPGHGLGLRLERLLDLTGAADAQVTVLVEADCHFRLLASQLLPRSQRIPGRRVGMFLRQTNFIHRAKRPLSLASGMESVRRFTRGLAPDDRSFMDFVLPRFGLLDAALCLDEAFVESRGAPFAWLPDIYRYSGQTSADAGVETSMERSPSTSSSF